MTRFWTAGLDYWVRLPKATLIAAVSDAPGLADRSAHAREEIVKAHAKLKKNELAAKVAAMFKSANYLPDILVTPVAAGGLALTQERVAAIAAPAVAAE